MMGRLSNLPPGVTDQDIERQAGAFDDLESDDLGENSPESPEAGLLSNLPHDEPPRAAAPQYRERCKRCNGTGRFSFASRLGTVCLLCGGAGYKVFKSSPEAREAARQRVKDREAAKAEARFEAWCEANPAEGAWLKANLSREDGGGGFVTACKQGIIRFGSPTANMVAAIHRSIERDAQRAEERAAEQFRAQEMARPVATVNLEAVEQAFDRAKGQGIKWPKLTLDGFKLAPAGENSRNRGAIYVTEGASREGAYLGKVLGGRFEPSRACDEATRDKVLAAMADPLASAVAYGKKFGRCAVCARELSDPESIERGIGPVCAERMGWA